MAETKKIKVELVRSTAGLDERQKRVIESLGLKRRHSTVVHDATPGIVGMVKKVIHLVRVEEVTG